MAHQLESLVKLKHWLNFSKENRRWPNNNTEGRGEGDRRFFLTALENLLRRIETTVDLLIRNDQVEDQSKKIPVNYALLLDRLISDYIGAFFDDIKSSDKEFNFTAIEFLPSLVMKEDGEIIELQQESLPENCMPYKKCVTYLGLTD